MTREQAKREIDDIDFYLQHHTDDYSERSHDAMMMAIQALSQEQISLNDINNALGASFRNGVRSAKVEQEPCDDAISRILKKMWNCRGKHTTSIDKVAMEQIIRDELPSVTQKSGKWITKDGKEQGYDIGGVKAWYIQIMCSECGFIKTAIEGRTGQYHYCPNCGAKMVEPHESEG